MQAWLTGGKCLKILSVESKEKYLRILRVLLERANTKVVTAKNTRRLQRQFLNAQTNWNNEVRYPKLWIIYVNRLLDYFRKEKGITTKCNMINWQEVNHVLEESAQMGFSTTEAIRKLAIREEAAGVSWQRVGALYYIGLAIGECNIEFFRSMAISALECLQTSLGVERAIYFVAQADAKWAVSQLLRFESPENADSLYLKASIIYWSVVRNISPDDNTLFDAITVYQQALEANPSHWLARYFLICCLFDLKDWPATLREINILIESRNHSEYQQWRKSKLEEWRIVCYFNLKEPKRAEELLAQFLDQFTLAKYPDMEGKIESLDELSECLEYQDIDLLLKARFEAFKSAMTTAGVI